jgi:hypothetical protein
MATLGKNHGHQWGDSMATSGEKPWPQLGRIRWPLTGEACRAGVHSLAARFDIGYVEMSRLWPS